MEDEIWNSEIPPASHVDCPRKPVSSPPPPAPLQPSSLSLVSRERRDWHVVRAVAGALEISFSITRARVRHLGSALTIFIMQKITAAGTSCFWRKKRRNSDNARFASRATWNLCAHARHASFMHLSRLTDDFGRREAVYRGPYANRQNVSWRNSTGKYYIISEYTAGDQSRTTYLPVYIIEQFWL